MDNSQVIKTQEFFEEFRKRLIDRYPNRIKVTDDLRADGYSLENSEELIEKLRVNESLTPCWDIIIEAVDSNLNKNCTVININLREGSFLITSRSHWRSDKELVPEIYLNLITVDFLVTLYDNILNDIITIGVDYD